MNSLASRKKLLIAESEFNRAQLVQDWRAMAGEAHALTKQAGTIGLFASAAASLVAGLLFFRKKTSAPVDEKPSWLKILLRGAGMAATLWSQFHSPRRD